MKGKRLSVFPWRVVPRSWGRRKRVRGTPSGDPPFSEESCRVGRTEPPPSSRDLSRVRLLQNALRASLTGSLGPGYPGLFVLLSPPRYGLVTPEPERAGSSCPAPLGPPPR